MTIELVDEREDKDNMKKPRVYISDSSVELRVGGGYCVISIDLDNGNIFIERDLLDLKSGYDRTYTIKREMCK